MTASEEVHSLMESWVRDRAKKELEEEPAAENDQNHIYDTDSFPF